MGLDVGMLRQIGVHQIGAFLEAMRDGLERLGRLAGVTVDDRLALQIMRGLAHRIGFFHPQLDVLAQNNGGLANARRIRGGVARGDTAKQAGFEAVHRACPSVAVA
jgi:hypothetical protein